MFFYLNARTMYSNMYKRKKITPNRRKGSVKCEKYFIYSSARSVYFIFYILEIPLNGNIMWCAVTNKAQKCNIEKIFFSFIILITSYKIEEIPRQKLRFSFAHWVSAEGGPGYFSPRTEPGALAESGPDWDLQSSWRWFSPPADCRWRWSCRPCPGRPPRSCHWKSLGARDRRRRRNICPPVLLSVVAPGCN